MTAGPKFVGVLLALVTLAYPLIIYLSLGRLEPRWLALLLLGLALARLVVSRTAVTWCFAAGALLLAVLSWAGNAWMPLKLYPVVVSAVLLALFAASLVYPPSAIERFARLREPDLPPEAVAYTRRVTQVWCLFFIFNGLMAFATALWASDAAWTLYNGLISYCLMGVLMAGEWLVRRRVRARIALANNAPGVRRAWGGGSENRAQRGQFLPDSQAHSIAMGQEDNEKWTAAVDLQPTTPKSDGLQD